MKANELKRGQVVNVDGRICMVRDVQAKSPSSRGGNTLYKVIFRDVLSRQKVEGSYKGDDVISAAELVRRPVQLLYTEGTATTVMDTEDYNQYALDHEAIEAELPYLTDNMSGLQLLLVEGAPAGLELPAAVELVVTECAPAMKAASSSARTKPATCTTGLVVQVPEYIAEGERIKVNTGAGEFMSRA